MFSRFSGDKVEKKSLQCRLIFSGRERGEDESMTHDAVFCYILNIFQKAVYLYQGGRLAKWTKLWQTSNKKVIFYLGSPSKISCKCTDIRNINILEVSWMNLVLWNNSFYLLNCKKKFLCNAILYYQYQTAFILSIFKSVNI